jgi:hypothetical protein
VDVIAQADRRIHRFRERSFSGMDYPAKPEHVSPWRRKGEPSPQSLYGVIGCAGRSRIAFSDCLRIKSGDNTSGYKHE